MMNQMRKHMKKVLWIVAGLFIIGIFFWYGTGGIKNYAARVNGTRIEIQEFQNEFSRRIRRYRNDIEGTVTDDDAMMIRQQALISLINQEILLQEAKRMGITVFDEEIIQTIRNLPQFQHEGQFHREMYRNVVRFSLDMTPDEFEKMIRSNIAVQKLEQAVISTAMVSDPELELYYKTEYGSIDNFQERAMELREEILQEKRISLYSYWMENLRDNARIDINFNVIQPPQRRETQDEPERLF